VGGNRLVEKFDQEEGKTSMLPFKKILVPTDFSDPAHEALNVAVELAQHFSASLLLVNVVPPIPVPTRPIAGSTLAEPGLSPSFDVTSYLMELTSSAKEGLQKLIKEHVPEGTSAQLSVSSGQPEMEILKIAKEEQADLIVIATHGQRGWRRFLFGSVAEKVVRLAERPVMVIHRPLEGETAT
jgi:nucleotide-binding universal stress UspA family protein